MEFTIHPIDAAVIEYHKTLDELTNVNRTLSSYEPHRKRKEELEKKIGELRKVLAGQKDLSQVTAPAVPEAPKPK